MCSDLTVSSLTVKNTTCVEIVASFQNGTLNERMVKMAQLLHEGLPSTHVNRRYGTILGYFFVGIA